MPAFRRGYQEMALQAQQEALSYERYLLSLAQRECQERHNNRIERLLRQSRLPLEKTWQALELKRLPARVVQQARTLLEGTFVDARENVLAFGVPGSGKTHVLCAIGQELVRSGRRVQFYSCNLLVQELLIAKRDLKLSRMLKRLAGYEVLILVPLPVSEFRARTQIEEGGIKTVSTSRCGNIRNVETVHGQGQSTPFASLRTEETAQAQARRLTW